MFVKVALNLGMVCSALGQSGEQKDFLEKFINLDLQILAFPRKGHNHSSIFKEPLLRDYHPVGSSYKATDPWQSLLIPKTSKGKKPTGNNNGTVITYRYYIQDMAFAAFLQVPSEDAKPISEALQNPYWGLCLGRKSCIPTEFIYQGIYRSIEECIQKAINLAEQKNRTLSFRVLQDVTEGETITLNDVPIQFGEQKKYQERQVTIIEMRDLCQEKKDYS